MSPEERFWADLKLSAAMVSACPACRGAGILAHQGDSGILWSMSCAWCDGEGVVTLVPERRGT